MAETSVTVVATKRDALDDIDVSFSSYLKPDNNYKPKKEQEEDTELSIFEARRYFSEIGSNDSSHTSNHIAPRFSSISSAKVSFCTVSQTASSEASWNSQTGLLNRHESDRNGRGSSKKGSLRGPRWFFRRRTCPCSSSKSVQVQETKPRNAEPRTGSDRVVHHNHQRITSSDPIRLTIPSNTVSNFSFPTLSSTHTSKSPVRIPIKPELNSIKPELKPASPKKITSDEEATSDASSDLFEIESFSTQHVARQWAPPAAAELVRNSIDETSTEYGYEPSEVSVTWSVTTAEPNSALTANFSRMAFTGSDKSRTGLLSCRSEKAVMVNGGQRLIQPLKSISIHEEVGEKVLCNNGNSKLSLTSRAMLNTKSSVLI